MHAYDMKNMQGIPESCRELSRHMAKYTDMNYLGQSLQLRCAIDRTDFSSDESV
jgi:hypothetical protein